ncbi:uncharacterized protein [Anabrus simplex]|uniref:uncharacterized protein isoform X1 n=1 Tax=Anabrus simplex TaxID=316456 RepID=UPI0035A27E0E
MSTAEAKSSRETQSSSLFPTFRQGDLFQVLSKDENPHWWAVRALSADGISEGFVPACYLCEVDGGITTTNVALVSPELKLVALSELRSRLAHSAHTGGVFPDPTMIPEPELCPGDDLEKRNRRNQGPPAPPLPPLSAEGLILPRKPPNPCLESVGHKNLHRELLFNQKVGKNVLNQKSELQKAFGKHREQQVRKELEQQRANAKSDLARMVEERARRMDLLDKGEEEPEKCSENEPEFLKVHAKMRARMDSK